MVSRMDTNFPPLVPYLSGLLRIPEGGPLGSPAGPADAAPGLQESAERAASQLHEDGAWYHLARLCLALADMRR